MDRNRSLGPSQEFCESDVEKSVEIGNKRICLRQIQLIFSFFLIDLLSVIGSGIRATRAIVKIATRYSEIAHVAEFNFIVR